MNEIFLFDYLQKWEIMWHEHWWDIHVDEVDNEAWVKKFMWMFHMSLVYVKVSERFQEIISLWIWDTKSRNGKPEHPKGRNLAPSRNSSNQFL